MNKESDSVSLFLVVLGGKIKKSHVEVHDVRWVAGNVIEDTFSQLRDEWIGNIKGLHIDSYKKIEYIDGYKILLKENSLKDMKQNEKSLWFINLGGYESSEMLEKHKLALYVCNSSWDARRKAKSLWNEKVVMKHNDNCSGLCYLDAIDNCHQIKKVKNWKVYLKQDPKNRSQEIIPDWYGYRKIDNFNA